MRFLKDGRWVDSDRDTEDDEELDEHGFPVWWDDGNYGMYTIPKTSGLYVIYSKKHTVTLVSDHPEDNALLQLHSALNGSYKEEGAYGDAIEITDKMISEYADRTKVTIGVLVEDGHIVYEY